MEMQCVFCNAETEFLIVIKMKVTWQVGVEDKHIQFFTGKSEGKRQF